jgi:hypothetical protein
LVPDFKKRNTSELKTIQERPTQGVMTITRDIYDFDKLMQHKKP